MLSLAASQQQLLSLQGRLEQEKTLDRKSQYSRFNRYWKQQTMTKINLNKLQVVVSTFGDSFSLQKAVKKGFFTHIFIEDMRTRDNHSSLFSEWYKDYYCWGSLPGRVHK